MPRRDATMRELSDLVKGVHEEALRHSSILSISVVYPDGRGDLRIRKLASVHATRYSKDDDVSLATLRFETGDFLDVAIM